MNKVDTEAIPQVMAVKKRRVSLLTTLIIGFFAPFMIVCVSAGFTAWGQDHLLYALIAWTCISVPLIITANMIWRCPACKRMLGKEKDPEACPHCRQAFTVQSKVEEPQQKHPSYF
jgi:cytochrome c oxidase assembly factor CtaG